MLGDEIPAFRPQGEVCKDDVAVSGQEEPGEFEVDALSSLHVKLLSWGW